MSEINDLIYKSSSIAWDNGYRTGLEDARKQILESLNVKLDELKKQPMDKDAPLIVCRMVGVELSIHTVEGLTL